MNEKQLIKAAIKARALAYAPYSHFKVGAALCTADGEIYQGCNIENSSYSLTICAERTAFFKAVYDGKKQFEAIAIVGGHEDNVELEICPACGACRQVFAEFCEGDFKIILAKNENEYIVKTLSQLLPMSFELK